MSNTRPPTSGAPSRGPRALRVVLLELEALLRDGVRYRIEGISDPADPRLSALEEELESAARSAPEEAARYARRLQDVRARLALTARNLPPGALDGLYDDVRAAADDVSPWARSRMSDAFLDAPRHLARWRSTALAACTLLALGAALYAGGRLDNDDGDPGTALERIDPRDNLLPRMDASGRMPLRDRRVREAGSFVRDAGPRGRTSSLRRRSGIYVWSGRASESAETQRRLDAVGVQVFPVGAPADDVERN